MNPPRTVLVVDDHPAVALAVEAAFRLDGGFTVAATAATAQEGLEALAARPFDAVLLDLHLPDLEGPALVEAFRRARAGVPLVLHSGVDDTPEVDAVRGLVDAVALKSRPTETLEALARLTRS